MTVGDCVLANISYHDDRCEDGNDDCNDEDDI